MSSKIRSYQCYHTASLPSPPPPHHCLPSPPKAFSTEKHFHHKKHSARYHSGLVRVMENTKEYLSKAVVTVVDHLGSVAANLDYQISQDNSVSETEFRINGLKQRLVTCQQYSHKLALTRLCWNAKFPRFHPRYIFPPMPDLKRSIEVSRKSVTQVAAKTISLNEFEAKEEVPLFLYTCDHKPSSGLDTVDADSASVLPVRDGLSILPKARNPFHFENTRKIKRTILSWKLKHNNDIFSFGRRSKRAT